MGLEARPQREYIFFWKRCTLVDGMLAIRRYMLLYDVIRRYMTLYDVTRRYNALHMMLYDVMAMNAGLWAWKHAPNESTFSFLKKLYSR